MLGDPLPTAVPCRERAGCGGAKALAGAGISLPRWSWGVGCVALAIVGNPGRLGAAEAEGDRARPAQSEQAGANSLLSGEELRRGEARLLLESGRRAMQAEDWVRAAAAFHRARQVLPLTPASVLEREEIVQGWTNASLARVRQLRRSGRRLDANELLAEIALDPEAAADPRVELEIANLDRQGEAAEAERLTAGGATGDHGAGIDGAARSDNAAGGGSASDDRWASESVAEEELTPLFSFALLDDGPLEPGEDAAPIGSGSGQTSVTELLLLGESQVRIGRLDDARESYHRVLAIDPYNRAARNGLEWLANERSEYDRSARNHARAELLADVESAWELPAPVADERGVGADPGAAGSGQGTDSLREQLRQTTIADFDVAEASLPEALDALRLLAAEAGLPVSIAWQAKGDAQLNPPTVTLQLSQVNLENLLDLLARTSSTAWTIERGIVVFRPADTDGAGLYTEVYTVPPGLLNQVTLSTQEAGFGTSAVNPFDNAATTATPGRQSVQQILESQGISFGPGSSVNYNRLTSTLSLTNTSDQHEQFRGILDYARANGEQMISVHCTIMRVSHLNSDELSFDSLLGAANLPGTDRAFLSGGNASDVSGDGPGQFPFNYPGTAGANQPVGTNPLSRGLRSGAEVIGPDSISQAINGALTRADNVDLEAPGILGLAGVFTDPQFQVLMRGLNQSTANDLVTTPSVVARSGQQVRITQVRNLLVPGDWDPPELPTNVGNTTNTQSSGLLGGFRTQSSRTFPVTPSHPTDFREDFEGVVMEVLPTVSGDGRTVTLDINPKFRQFEGFINYGSPITQPTATPLGIQQQIITENRILQPIFREYDLSTQVTILDGETLVLGGMLEDNVTQFVDKVPFLGDIPLLGRLFQSRGEERSRDALVFTVTVRVLDPMGLPLNE